MEIRNIFKGIGIFRQAVNPIRWVRSRSQETGATAVERKREIIVEPEPVDTNVYDWCPFCRKVTLHHALDLEDDQAPLLVCQRHFPGDELTPEERGELSSL